MCTLCEHDVWLKAFKPFLGKRMKSENVVVLVSSEAITTVPMKISKMGEACSVLTSSWKKKSTWNIAYRKDNFYWVPILSMRKNYERTIDGGWDLQKRCAKLETVTINLQGIRLIVCSKTTLRPIVDCIAHPFFTGHQVLQSNPDN